MQLTSMRQPGDPRPKHQSLNERSRAAALRLGFKFGGTEETTMSDLKQYVEKRKARDPEFAENYETGYLEFKIGVLLRQAREEAGLTQEEVAQKLNTKKSAISRMENHAEDVKLSTLGKYAKVLGKKLHLSVR